MESQNYVEAKRSVSFPNSIFKQLLFKKLKEIRDKTENNPVIDIPKDMFNRQSRGNYNWHRTVRNEMNPHVRVMKRGESPFVPRIMRANVPVVRVMKRADEEMSPHVRVMKKDDGDEDPIARMLFELVSSAAVADADAWKGRNDALGLSHVRIMKKDGSPHIRVMKKQEGMSPHVRVMRGYDLSPHVRVMRDADESISYVRVMRND